MKITENTKGLTGSITNIDTDELKKLEQLCDRYKKALEILLPLAASGFGAHEIITEALK